MIGTEVFIIAKLFTDNSVSWWWILLFILSDALTWGAIKEFVESL